MAHATPPFSIDESKPADSDFASQHPVIARDVRDNIEAWMNFEHAMASGRHKIPTGTVAARDAITDWEHGSLWLNEDATPDMLQINNGTKATPVWLDVAPAGVITTRGDVIIGDSGGVANRLAIGAADTVFQSDGTDGLWGTIATAMIAANAVDGTKIALGSDAQGDIMYYNGTNWVRLVKGTNGEFLKIGASIPAWETLPSLTLDTMQSASGSTVSFTGIASTVKRITVMFDRISLSGTDFFLVQLGDSGGFETSGYVSASGGASASGVADASSTSGFAMYSANAGYIWSGSMTLTLMDAASDLWVSSHALGNDAVFDFGVSGGGKKALTGTLTQVRVTRSGSNTFDGGNINIAVE